LERNHSHERLNSCRLQNRPLSRHWAPLERGLVCTMHHRSSADYPCGRSRALRWRTVSGCRYVCPATTRVTSEEDGVGSHARKGDLKGPHCKHAPPTLRKPHILHLAAKRSSNWEYSGPPCQRISLFLSLRFGSSARNGTPSPSLLIASTRRSEELG